MIISAGDKKLRKECLSSTSNASQIRKEKDLRNELTPLISLEEQNKLAFDRDHKSPIVEIALLAKESADTIALFRSVSLIVYYFHL